MGKSVNEHGVCVYSGFWWKLALPHVVLPVHLIVVAGTFAWAASRATGWVAIALGIGSWKRSAGLPESPGERLSGAAQIGE
jgi:hypothetical protein